MNSNSNYIFQSPSSSQMQIDRLDLNTKQDKSTIYSKQNENKAQETKKLHISKNIKNSEFNLDVCA